MQQSSHLNEFNELKKQVESLNSKNGPLEKMSREIHFYEQDLRLNGINFEYSMLLSKLEPEKEDETFGPHGYTRKNYQLNWQKVEKSFFLTLTNVLANKSIKLRECPEHLQQIVFPLINPFILQMADQFKNNCEFDESYATELKE
jgi:hypothetical protein